MQNHISTPQRRALWALSIAYFIQATGSLSVAGSLAPFPMNGDSAMRKAPVCSLFSA
jgi:hypothetical protein